MKKKEELEKEVAVLREKTGEWHKREDWFVMKINCMTKTLKEMEHKIEEGNNKEELCELEVEDFRVKMEEVEAKNEHFRVKVEEAEAKNVVLIKRLEEEVEYRKKLVNVFIAMVIALFGMGIFLCLGGKGMLKKKMLALP